MQTFKIGQTVSRANLNNNYMKNLEIRTIEHKGIKVTIKIDYDDSLVSLVERNMQDNYTTKNWIFQDRGLEYMNEWLNILEAMSVAIKEGKKELETNLAEKTKLVVEKRKK
jgi:hypothetical protein